MFYNLLEGTTGTSNPITIILFGVIIVGMIALLVWQSVSNKKKQKEAQNMVNNLKKGDRVKTIGGVCGFVSEINNEENTFVLETGSNDNKCFLKFDKGAIYQSAPAQGNAVPAPKVEEKTENNVQPEEKKENQLEEKSEKKINSKKIKSENEQVDKNLEKSTEDKK